MHKLLDRQIRKLWPEAAKLTLFTEFLNAVSNAYKSTDDERKLVEHALNLTSQELFDRNELLREKVAQLESTRDELENSLSTIRATFDSTREGVFSVDIQTNLVDCNEVARKIIGLPQDTRKFSANLCIKKVLSKVENRKTLIESFKNSTSPPSHNERYFLTTEFKDGQAFEIYSVPKKHADQLTGRVWCFRDITEYRNSQKLIEHQANHDALTNLPNRLLLKDRIEHAISTAKREKNQLALIFVDLDHFKKVNDSAGHQVGDQVLRLVAHRIKQHLREGDTLARVGGDEFVVLAEKVTSSRTVSTLASRIIQTLVAPIEFNKVFYTVGCSIGISLYPSDGKKADELLRKADMAMYHAKQNGRSNHKFFDYSLERLALYRLDVEESLRKAIQDDDLYLVYQPKMNITTRKFSGAEALLRWEKNGKHVPPDEIIAIAEQTGIIHDLSRWVFTHVCRTIRDWASQGIQPPKIAVNFSAINISDSNFNKFLVETMKQFQIKGEWLEFEITESVLLENTDDSQIFMALARNLNIKLSMDDFGTGYSSLSYIHKLRVDVIKIDKSFILNLLDDVQNQAITSTIIMLAKNLDLEVIAEGVENEETHQWLINQGCYNAQGYHYYRPLPFSEFDQLLHSDKYQSS